MTTIEELEKEISDREVQIKNWTPEIPDELKALKTIQMTAKNLLVALHRKESEIRHEKQRQIFIGATVIDIDINDVYKIEEVVLKKGDKKIRLSPAIQYGIAYDVEDA